MIFEKKESMKKYSIKTENPRISEEIGQRKGEMEKTMRENR